MVGAACEFRKHSQTCQLQFVVVEAAEGSDALLSVDHRLSVVILLRQVDDRNGDAHQDRLNQPTRFRVIEHVLSLERWLDVQTTVFVSQVELTDRVVLRFTDEVAVPRLPIKWGLRVVICLKFYFLYCFRLLLGHCLDLPALILYRRLHAFSMGHSPADGCSSGTSVPQLPHFFRAISRGDMSILHFGQTARLSRRARSAISSWSRTLGTSGGR